MAHRAFSFFMALLCFVLASAAFASEAIGWRTDGSGNYPKAQPPVEWSTAKNVAWMTPMPGASNSLPVLSGDRLFICSEPCMLLCLNKQNGRILWQKNSGIDDLEIDPALREKLKMEQSEAARLDKQFAVLAKDADSLKKKLKDDPTAKEAIDKQLAEIKAKTESLKDEKKKLALATRYTPRSTHSSAGYSTPTPVTNGKEVFVAFGNGLVACFDLEGNRQWLKLIEQSTASFAHANSPILVDDKVLIHFADMVALSAKDGSEIWRLKKAPTHGTSMPARIGDVPVVVTPNGFIIRVDNGTVLAEGLGSCGANSPILHDGTAYFIRGGATAVKLPLAIPLPGKLQPLWKGKVKGGGYWFPSPVLSDGLLYAVDDRGIFSVLDAKNGNLVYEERVELGGTVYPSVSVAGNYVYLSSDNGKTLIIKTGLIFDEVGRNQLEPFRSSLVFEDKRMYVRTQKNLYCIGE